MWNRISDVNFPYLKLDAQPVSTSDMGTSRLGRGETVKTNRGKMDNIGEHVNLREITQKVE